MMNLGVLVKGALLRMIRYVVNMTELYTQSDRLLGHIKCLSES